ncbi:BppU family phage baseplate upper protein [Bacillus thuringiensis]|uniref:BppU family phage baseplate upper protein n=1 Tax=Bacillus thuringiensis TaxID=1428 RepID=UPI003459427A
MRNEEIMIDLADPVFTKTIRSRQNDKNGLKITVYVKENGRSIDLTGYAVKYEALNVLGQFVRDDAQIVDAKNGVFSYTFTPQAVSTSDDWTAYFVMEKSTERISTPDIRITLRRDVKEGNIKIENYISDFDKAIERVKGYRKEIDDANKQIKDLTPYIQTKVEEINKKIAEVNAAITANGVVKKIGDTMLGILRIDYKGEEAPFVLSNKFGTLRFLPQTLVNYLQSGTLDGKAKNLFITGHNDTIMEQVKVKTKELLVDGTVKQGADIHWTPLSTTGVDAVADRPLRYKKTGHHVCVIGSVKNVKNVVNFATLPSGCRPVQNIAFPALAYGNDPIICEVTVQSDGTIFVNGVQNGQTVHIVANFMA